MAISIATCRAQNKNEVDSLVHKLIQLYENGSYLGAEIEGRRLLEQASVPNTVRIQIEKYIAFALIAQDKPQAAVSHFNTILQADSTFDLDSQLTSPKIMVVFQQTREKFFAQRVTESKHISIPVSNTSISYRAVLFPGWEQLYRGRTTTGYTFFTLGAASFLSTVYCDFRRRDSRNSYLQAGTMESAIERYKTYNNFQKAEIYSASIFVLTYIISEVDIFTKISNETGANISLSPGKNFFTANLSISF